MHWIATFGMQMQRQRDDDGFEVLLLVEHFLNARVHVTLDVLRLPSLAVDLRVALARRRGGSPVMMRFRLYGRMSQSGDELEILRVVVAHEDAALVAAADEGGLDRLALHRLVAVIGGGRDRHERAARDDGTLHEPAAG